MRRFSFVLVLAVACGGSDSSDSSEDSSGDEDVAAMLMEDVGDSPPAEETNVPSDFSIRQAGGPVRRDDDYAERQTSVEPSGNGFVLVVRDVGRDGATEVVRAEVDAYSVQPVYDIVVERREELAGECINPNIRDGHIRKFFVTLDGEEHEFRCTNSATPAFEALAEAFDELAIRNTPAH